MTSSSAEAAVVDTAGLGVPVDEAPAATAVKGNGAGARTDCPSRSAIAAASIAGPRTSARKRTSRSVRFAVEQAQHQEDVPVQRKLHAELQQDQRLQ